MIPNEFPTLNFGLGETADQLRASVRGFTADEIAPIAAEIDRTNEFPRQLWPKLGALGLHGITVEEEYGGSGLGYLEHCIAMEEVSRGSASVGLSYGAHSNLCVNQIRRNGTDAQKRRYLPKLISGEHVGALAMSEPGAGSDVVSMKLRADRKGDRYVLNGTKFWITNGPCADVLVVYAKTDPAAGPRGITAFLIEKGFKGFSHRAEARQARHARLRHRRADLRGLRGARRERAGRGGPGRQRADERARLRARGAGGRAARHHAGGHGRGDPLRARSASSSASRSASSSWCRASSPTCTPTMNACRAYVYAVAKACDRGETARKDAAGAILYAAEKATQLALDAVQLLGGNGYINDYPTGRLLRDAKLYEIGAGTSEIRRWLIGRELFAETA